MESIVIAVVLCIAIAAAAIYLIGGTLGVIIALAALAVAVYVVFVWPRRGRGRV